MRELDEHPAPPPLTGALAATDVFLSYSRADTDAVLRLRATLKSAGLATFLDRDQLPAGQSWLTALEQGIAGCGAVAVLVGPAGLGTWQRREVQLALDRQAELERQGRLFPVIPVILPGVGDPPGGFLKLQTWVDLRADSDDPAQLDLLLKGIRGQPVASADLREAICPYRGLLAFREEDAGLFFGREEEVAGLVEKVRHEPLLTLIGRSGSGKSSVVSAGLIPALRRRADGRSWAVVSLRPGDAPLHALVRAFYTPPADLTPFELDRKIKDQVAILRADPEALADRVHGLLAGEEERGTDRLLLYVDQWEELYTQARLHPALTPEQAEADVARFIDLLLHAACTAPCTVVLTLRADFYGDLLRHEALAAAVPPGLVNLGPLGRADLARAIRQPASAVGLAVDGALVETLLDAVAEDLGKLPLLEYALKETWQRRREQRLTMDSYGEAGGIDGAVAQRADEIYASLDESGRVATRQLFVSLVTPGEGREDTRARIALTDNPAIAAVVRAFSGADARLLVTGDHLVPAGDLSTAPRLVEISHEALIREWQPLKGWVEANRDMLRRRERIRDWMTAWEQNDRNTSLLLPPGLALEEGRKLLADHGDVLIDEVGPYVEKSIAADVERQRQVAAQVEEQRRREAEAADAERRRELAAAQQLAEEQRKRTRLAFAASLFALLLAVLAGWQWREAGRQADIAKVERDKAENNLRAAARAADGLVFDLAQQLREVTGVSTETIRLILSRADALLADLAPGDDAPPELRRARAAALNEFATTYLTQGDLDAAQAAAEQSRDIIAKLAAADPGNAERQRDLSVSWNKLGDVRRVQGDLPGALQAFTESKNIRDKLAAADPGNAERQRDLSISWERLGNVHQAQGDLQRALQAFTEGKNIRDKLAAADPGNAERQRDLSVSWNKLGDVRRVQGDLPGALQAFTADMKIAASLAAADPGNAQWQRDLVVSWSKLGDVRQAQGDLPGALQAYTEAKNIADKLAAADPGNAEWQRDLSVSWGKLGDVRQAHGDLPGALQAFTADMEIIAKLAAADPGNTGWQRDLSVSWDTLGDVLVAKGDLTGALQAFTDSKNIRDKLAATDPGNAEWQRDLIVSHWKLADLLERTPDRAAEAAGHWAQALAIAHALVDTGRLAPTDAHFVATLEQRLAAAPTAPGPPP